MKVQNNDIKESQMDTSKHRWILPKKKKNRKTIFDLNEKFSDSCHEKELNRNLGTE